MKGRTHSRGDATHEVKVAMAAMAARVARAATAGWCLYVRCTQQQERTRSINNALPAP